MDIKWFFQFSSRFPIRNLIRRALLAFLSLLSCSVYAQQAVTSGGGEVNSFAGSVSFSVGQVVSSHISGNNGTINQGVQQPYEIYVITFSEETAGIALTALAYPNPTTEYLTLRIDDFEFRGLSCYLFDMSGKVVLSQEIKDSETHLSTQAMNPGTYLLKLVKADREVKNFKIVKL